MSWPGRSELRIPKPPIIALALLILVIVLHFTVPPPRIILFPFNLLGILVAIFGRYYVAGKAGKIFKKAGTSLHPSDKPKTLVTKWPYSFSRNPMYLGVVLLLLGVALFIGTAITFIAPVAFLLIMNYGFIPFEEKMLKKVFGKKYEVYKKRVRRWV